MESIKLAEDVNSDTTFSTSIENAVNALKNNNVVSFEAYQRQIIDAYQGLLQKVSTENEMIVRTYPGTATSRQKSVYIDQSSATLSTVNTYLFWIYIASAVILTKLIVMKPYSILFKIFIVGIVIAFPFYIYPAEIITYQVTMYIYSVLLSVVYNNGYGNKIPEYYLTGMEDLKKVL